MIARALRAIRRCFPALVIGGAFAWSATVIFRTRAQESPPGIKTLRIAHWQLEVGVRDALEALGKDYQQIHPEVRIVQEAIPTDVYPTWVTTNLMGGTAPDMIQIGKLQPHLLVSYYSRYFVPITPHIDEPNPYNDNSDGLKGVPLRQTYRDGMRNAYVEELQEYMNVPLSLFAVRLFYNRKLLKELTGLDEPPMEYRAFLKACHQIKSRKDAKGQYYIPIACAKDELWSWEGKMFKPLTYECLARADFDRDGLVSNYEQWVAVKAGLLSFQTPAWRARFRMTEQVTSYFPIGFTGLGHDDAVFMFAQQRAVFISAGTWDARSLEEQADKQFEIGIVDFPMPTREDAEFGPFMQGPAYDDLSNQVGFPFGITKTCKHQKEAMDFLLFLAGQKQNEKLNRIMGWIPIIRGARADTYLQSFDPHLDGVYGTVHFDLGAETTVRWDQVYSLFLAQQISYEQMAGEFEPFYRERGLRDYEEAQRNWRRGMHLNEQLLASLRFKALSAHPAAAPGAWLKYRDLACSRQFWPEIRRGQQLKLLEPGNPQAKTEPYSYSAQAMRRIRQTLKQGL